MQEIANNGVQVTPQAAEPCQGVQAEVNEPISSQSSTIQEKAAAVFAQRRADYLQRNHELSRQLRELKREYHKGNQELEKIYHPENGKEKLLRQRLDACHRLKRYIDKAVWQFSTKAFTISPEQTYSQFVMGDDAVTLTVTIPFSECLTVKKEEQL